jgi:oligopeptide transport system permease protein
MVSGELTVLDGAAVPEYASRDHTLLRRFVRHRAALLGAVLIAAFSLMALLAPLIDRYPPAEQHYDGIRSGPSARFWLGSDNLGRDQYSRLVHGARVSLSVGVLSQVVAVGLGLTVGLAAGLGGRWLDALLMRVTDVAYAFPDLLMLIWLLAVFGSSFTMVVLAIGLVTWPTIARLVRGQVLSLREEEFVLAARALGANEGAIAIRHLLPNVLGPVIVTATFGVPAAIFAEAALAFIGIGFALETPTWGRLVADSRGYISSGPAIIVVSSCAAVALTMLSFTLIGDGLRDALDPRAARGRRPSKADLATLEAEAPSSEARRAA